MEIVLVLQEQILLLEDTNSQWTLNCMKPLRLPALEYLQPILVPASVHEFVPTQKSPGRCLQAPGASMTAENNKVFHLRNAQSHFVRLWGRHCDLYVAWRRDSLIMTIPEMKTFSLLTVAACFDRNALFGMPLISASFRRPSHCKPLWISSLWWWSLRRRQFVAIVVLDRTVNNIYIWFQDLITMKSFFFMIQALFSENCWLEQIIEELLLSCARNGRS